MMPFSKFLEERKSIRKYKEREVEKVALDQLKSYIDSIQNRVPGGTLFKFIDDGKFIYQRLKGKGGYAGVMIKAPHYLGIVFEDDNELSIIDVGYYVEDIISKASELGLGTCWVSLNNIPDDIKEDFAARYGGKLDFVIAIGYSDENKGLQPFSTSSRLAVEEIVFYDEWGNNISMDYLVKRGLDKLFYYVRYAPSGLNRQPWRFIVRKDRVILALKNSNSIETLVDAGIMMYYFEKMIHSIGFKGIWNKLELKDKGEREEYRMIAEFMI